MYNIFFKPSADKELSKLPSQVIEKVLKAINELKETQRPQGFKKLKGKDGFRIRIGDYRVIYLIDDESKTIRIIGIGSRKDIYKDK